MPERFPWWVEECFWDSRQCCFSTWPGRASEDRYRAGRSLQFCRRTSYPPNTNRQCKRGCTPTGWRTRKKACSGRCRTRLRAHQCRQVFLRKDGLVMEHMAGDDERHRENGDWFAASRAVPKPGRVIEGTDERDGGAADGHEFFQ